jgi:hypothetical protein
MLLVTYLKDVRDTYTHYYVQVNFTIIVKRFVIVLSRNMVRRKVNLLHLQNFLNNIISDVPKCLFDSKSTQHYSFKAIRLPYGNFYIPFSVHTDLHRIYGTNLTSYVYLNYYYYYYQGVRGSIVVKALSYKPESRRFNSRGGNWIVSLF